MKQGYQMSDVEFSMCTEAKNSNHDTRELPTACGSRGRKGIGRF